MKAYSVIVILALLLTVHLTDSGSITSAGFGSDIVSGINRLVSKITNSNNENANVTTANVTRTNTTRLTLEIVCPPPTPEEVFSTFRHSGNKT